MQLTPCVIQNCVQNPLIMIGNYQMYFKIYNSSFKHYVLHNAGYKQFQ